MPLAALSGGGSDEGEKNGAGGGDEWDGAGGDE
jgi:hypothetical protein